MLRALTDVVTRTGARWAWQGSTAARDRWSTDTGSADLDLWTDAEAAESVAESLDAWPAARVADARDPRRLRHVSHAVETADGLALVDLTYGDLRVGAVLLVPSNEISVAGDRLTGVAGAADLVMRKLLRGGVPDPDRLDEGRAAWAGATPAARDSAVARWGDALGRDVINEVVRALEGAPISAELPQRMRTRLARATLAPSGLAAAWSQRHAVLPSGRSAGPLGLRTRGVVVVLVGTDGSGKSTVADTLSTRLERCGFEVRTAYFGMARGNLPGVGLARRLFGVAEAGDGATPTHVEPPTTPVTLTDQGSPTSAHEVGTNDVDAMRRDLGHPGVRRLAAWYYAAEYAWRYASTVSPSVRRRRIVICDRYVYDLRESPWPGSFASKLVEAVVPAPDVLVLPDAPVELIHARKPERTFAEQSAQQERFRALLSTQPARVAEVRVDTSGEDPDGVADVVAAVVTAAHRPRRSPR